MIKIINAYLIANMLDTKRFEKSKWELNHLNNSIQPYSAKNNNTNKNLENSTLNPLTNSLSPSAKSKGARLVSAKITNKKINTTGKNNIALENGKVLHLMENPRNKGKNKIK